MRGVLRCLLGPSRGGCRAGLLGARRPVHGAPGPDRGVLHRPFAPARPARHLLWRPLAALWDAGVAPRVEQPAQGAPLQRVHPHGRGVLGGHLPGGTARGPGRHGPLSAGGMAPGAGGGPVAPVRPGPARREAQGGARSGWGRRRGPRPGGRDDGHEGGGPAGGENSGGRHGRLRGVSGRHRLHHGGVGPRAHRDRLEGLRRDGLPGRLAGRGGVRPLRVLGDRPRAGHGGARRGQQVPRGAVHHAFCGLVHPRNLRGGPADVSGSAPRPGRRVAGVVLPLPRGADGLLPLRPRHLRAAGVLRGHRGRVEAGHPGQGRERPRRDERHRRGGLR